MGCAVAIEGEMTKLMGSPRDRKYTKTHEWVSLDGDVATIGITDFAQAELGDITYLELPEVGDPIALDQALDSPESINQSPYDDAWLVRVRVSDPGQLDRLLSESEYDAFAQSSAH
jgi:glycine cleavage system H protein